MYRVQSQTQQIHAVEGYTFDATNVAHSGVPVHQSATAGRACIEEQMKKGRVIGQCAQSSMDSDAKLQPLADERSLLRA
jgi:hypothetical protein